MATLTKTLKLPFLRLNRSQAALFERLQKLNTDVANSILAMPKEQRRALTSKAFANVEIGSAWINQTIRYKAMASGVKVEAVRPHYISKTCHRCGALNERKKHAYVCTQCGYKGHADANAAMNIRDWQGLCCLLGLEVQAGGPYDPALKRVSQTAAQAAA